MTRKLKYFRWRIFPAFASIGLSCAVAFLFYNNVIIGEVPVTHPAHFLIFVSGVIWILASVFWFRGNWRLATAATFIGFLLPFFRPI